MTTDISNTDNVVDSRDILERIEELETEMEEYQEKHKLPSFDWTGKWQGSEYDEWNKTHRKNKIGNFVAPEWDRWDNVDEYCQLKEVEEQCDGYGDWKYGETLIRDDYFTEYIEELIEDCYMTKEMRDIMSQWPWRHLDMEAAAEEAKQDYMEVDWDGVTYWMRS